MIVDSCILVWHAQPPLQREKGSGDRPIPDSSQSPETLGNNTLPVLLMELHGETLGNNTLPVLLMELHGSQHPVKVNSCG